MYRGRFLFGRRLEEIAFSPQKAEDSDTYAEGSSGEDDINTEDGSGRARFQYGGEDGSGDGII